MGSLLFLWISNPAHRHRSLPSCCHDCDREVAGVVLPCGLLQAADRQSSRSAWIFRSCPLLTSCRSFKKMTLAGPPAPQLLIAAHEDSRAIAVLKCVRENWVVPPGLYQFAPLHPALKRWAKVARPYGAGLARVLFHRFQQNTVLTHTLKRCATQNQSICAPIKTRSAEIRSTSPHIRV